MPGKPRHHQPKTTILLLVTAALAAGALAGCGGSSGSTAAGTTQKARLTPSESNPDVGTTNRTSNDSSGASTHARPSSGHHASTSGLRHSGPTIRGRSRNERTQKGRTSSLEENEDNKTLDHLANPCRLVSASQAGSILGEPTVRPVEAPLGPTCIYQPKASKANVTLSVQSVAMGPATLHLAHRQTVPLQGHKGVCGKLGTQMLYVPLSDGQVLNVTAPCSVAVKFASIALGRLGA